MTNTPPYVPFDPATFDPTHWDVVRPGPMTAAECQLVDAAVIWWNTNRTRSDVVPGAPMYGYYQQDDVAALVCASADVARERGEA